MRNETYLESIELHDEFIQGLDDTASQDENGVLETVQHDDLMDKLDKIFTGINHDIVIFEDENPDFV